MCTLTIEPGPNLTRKILQIRNLPNNSFEQIIKTVKFNALWSVCLPDSCPVSDVERHFNRTLKGITEGLDLNISLNNESCVSYSSTKPISDVQWIVIIGFTSLFIFITICTIYDIFMTKYEQTTVNEALLVFSAYSNSKVIFSSDGTSQLDCLNGVRSLSIIWVVLGHRYFHTMYIPIVNGLDVLDWLQTIPSTIIVGGTVSVDSFFMVSGLLVSYLFFKTMSEDGTVNVILFYLYRYLRVTPVLGAVVLIYATLTELIGWIIFACVHGKAGLINSILSCYVFKVIAKLSYCMFLIHMYIMFTMAGAEKTTYYFSNENMIYMFFGDMAFTLAASYILAISVEFPTMRLGGLIRKRGIRISCLTNYNYLHSLVIML
ncbi:uncharacterized protein CBL_00431 [Carabus blaptoides fortunei]